MTKDIRRHELVEGTTDEEAGKMKQQMRVEEAQRLRRAQQSAAQEATTDKAPGQAAGGGLKTGPENAKPSHAMP